jgi:hypothetical protein
MQQKYLTTDNTDNTDIATGFYFSQSYFTYLPSIRVNVHLKFMWQCLGVGI